MYLFLGNQPAMIQTKPFFDGTAEVKNADFRKIWPILGSGKNSGKVEVHFAQKIRNGAAKSRILLHSSVHPTERPSMEDDDAESFHRAIGPILALAQWFGVLPVCGVCLPSPEDLALKKPSLRLLYSVIISCALLIVASVSFLHMVRTLGAETFQVQGGVGAATAGAVFYGNGVLGAILFLWLSPRWIPLQRQWRAMERLIDSKHKSVERPRLRWKFLAIVLLVLLPALTEHILSILTNTPDYIWESGNSTFSHFLQVYTERSHSFLLTTWKYDETVGIFVFIISKIATFIWNFTDLFIMLVSTGLAERYKFLNRRILTMLPSSCVVEEWEQFREKYAALSSLVKKVDDNVSPIILLSFANNLYFICLQLLNGLSPSEYSLLHSMYFFGSFGFLVGRTIAVTLLTARINDQSKMALPALYNCPTPMYRVETQRLLQQLATDEIALTGLRFFSITRNFMLAVAGAIATYEVVLLQFNVAMKT
ncbi:gustatory receptor 5a for trehalose [Orussus abietinus]|uniref:gustatory receptor 5a for trehalose n=1 Tax=Orussus abietinus TaxID=222816 RepID=UPI000625D5F5|nr:gustatory receptor 5a for trehalose [Orussus abietinus]